LNTTAAYFRLTFRPPYAWDAIVGFLSARATPGVESVNESRYRRTIAIHGTHGSIEVSRLNSGRALGLAVHFPDPRAHRLIVQRVRRMFDVDADPAAVEAGLGTDPFLRAALAAYRGIRMPGAWDGFELAVRAILGQQISVAAATTIAGRLAGRFGSPVAGPAGLVRLFPSPAQLANAAIEEIGVVTTRAEAIRRLARTVVEGAIALNSCSDGRATLAALAALPGIGTWTTGYIAMRAFGDCDAFPSGDRILRQMTGVRTARELDRRSESWRPWRSYAVMLLWQVAKERPKAGPPRVTAAM
jgi:AraC family transcriptional regulator of adaptative response / DNA-3-methyladenine glycosylase II